MKKLYKFLCLYILIFLLLCIPNIINTGNIDELPLMILFFTIFYVVFCGFIYLMYLIMLGPIVNLAKNKRKEGKYVERTTDMKYFRELPSYYTPVLVSYINDNSLEHNKDVLVTILNLIHKKYLKLENKEIVATNKELKELSLHELYIYNCIVEKRKFSFYEWKSIVEKDLMDLKLVEFGFNDRIKKKLLMYFFLCIAMIIGMNFVFDVLTSLNDMLYILIILGIYFSILGSLLFFIYKTIAYGILFISSGLILTEKGKADKEKIYMFRNFLKDFTMLDDKKTEEIYIWDEYLLYAMVLNINKKIYEEKNWKEIINKSNELIVSDWKNNFVG